MVLLVVLYRLRTLLKLDLRVAHVHHGLRPISQKSFRSKAFRAVKTHCEANNIELVSNAHLSARVVQVHDESSKILKSEADLRDFRYELFKRWRVETGSSLLALAHSADDLLETRLIRLIRGVGQQGLQSMSLVNEQGLLRPLLQMSRKDILAYARSQKIKWVEDPSNRREEPLRNWLRHSWLPALDRKHRGGRASLARSLHLLASQGPVLGQLNLRVTELNKDGALDRGALATLTPDAQRHLIARYMKHLCLKNYSVDHVNEILKRLDNRRRRHSFKLLGRIWVITENEIRASRD